MKNPAKLIYFYQDSEEELTLRGPFQPNGSYQVSHVDKFNLDKIRVTFIDYATKKEAMKAYENFIKNNIGVSMSDVTVIHEKNIPFLNEIQYNYVSSLLATRKQEIAVAIAEAKKFKCMSKENILSLLQDEERFVTGLVDEHFYNLPF